MRRSASEIIRNLEMRVARLEKSALVNLRDFDLVNDMLGQDKEFYSAREAMQWLESTYGVKLKPTRTQEREMQNAPGMFTVSLKELKQLQRGVREVTIYNDLQTFDIRVASGRKSASSRRRPSRRF